MVGSATEKMENEQVSLSRYGKTFQENLSIIIRGEKLNSHATSPKQYKLDGGPDHRR